MIAPPLRARVDSYRFAELLRDPLAIVHVGQSALVLRDTVGARLVTLTDAVAGVTPGGASIPAPTEFARVRRDVSRASGLVDLAAWTSILDPVDLGLAPRHMPYIHLAIPTPSTTFDAGLTRTRSRAAELASAALGGDLTVVGELVGAGPGTTPTGDDMIVGALAALHLAARTADARRLAATALPLLPRTTQASRHYVRAATSGRFAEHVHVLVGALERAVPADEVLAIAECWGASSGIDLLVGLSATLRAHHDLAREGAA